MKIVIVRPKHKRFKRKSFKRRARPPSKKRKKDAKPTRFYLLRDANGRLMGVSSKPPRRKK
jgi:hypothetical protein